MENTVDLAQKFLDRVEHEYTAYIEDIKTRDPDYIINHAYEIVIMADLRMILEENEFSLPALQELDKLEKPLTSFYDEWLKNDCGYMEQLRKTVDSFAEKRLRKEAQRLYTDPSVPRYDKDFSKSRENDEVHLYHANRRRDIECIRYFDKHVYDAHENHKMKEFTQEWADRFGRDRCKFVLGYTVQRADWDGRYAPQAKRDVQQYQYPQNQDYDYFSEYGTNIHPCLVDLSYRVLMDLERGKSKTDKER